MPISDRRKQFRALSLALLLVLLAHLLVMGGLIGGWLGWPDESEAPVPESLSVRLVTPAAPPQSAPRPTSVRPKPTPEPAPAAQVAPDMPAAGAADSGVVPQTPVPRLPPAAERLPKAGRLAVEAFWGEYQLGAAPLGRGEIEIGFPADDRYVITLSARAVRWLSVFVSGEVKFLSEGRLGPDGLIPERFYQSTPRQGPSESRFDLDRGLAQLKPGGPELPMPPGVQDRLSVVFQLALWGQSRPGGLQPGETLAVPLAGRSEVRQLRFSVGDREDLVLPGGILVSAIRISSDPFEFSRQGQIEMWLDPADRYFPARILYREPSGRTLDFLAIRPVF